MNDHDAFPSENRTAIETTIESALAIANESQDWNRYSELLYATDATLLVPNLEPVVGRSAIADFIKETFPGLTAFDLHTVSLEGCGDLAYVQGTYQLDMTTRDGPVIDRGTFLQIWKRQPKGGWKISVYSSNSSLPAA